MARHAEYFALNPTKRCASDGAGKLVDARIGHPLAQGPLARPTPFARAVIDHSSTQPVVAARKAYVGRGGRCRVTRFPAALQDGWALPGGPPGFARGGFFAGAKRDVSFSYN